MRGMHILPAESADMSEDILEALTLLGGCLRTRTPIIHWDIPTKEIVMHVSDGLQPLTGQLTLKFEHVM